MNNDQSVQVDACLMTAEQVTALLPSIKHEGDIINSDDLNLEGAQREPLSPTADGVEQENNNHAAGLISTTNGCESVDLTTSDTELLPPIVLYDLKALRTLGRTPRSPEDKSLQVQYDQVDRDKALIVFVSHSWLRGWFGAKGWDGRPHPDTPTHDKFQLLLTGLDKAMKTLAPGMEECFVWIDYGCIDQDATACLELKMLDKIIGVCDLMITLIYDESGDFAWHDEILRNGVSYMYEQYRSPSWNQGDHAYLSRAWCRIEMFYAANIPLEPSSPSRIAKFNAGLLHGVEAGRRPHLLYGSSENRFKGKPPIILPPLQNFLFDRYSPVKGKLTKETDRVYVQRLVDELLPYMARVNQRNMSDRYEGEMKHFKPHGRGIYRFAGGDVYDGEWKDDKKHGKGVFRLFDGSGYEGEWKDGFPHGRCIYRDAIGSVFDGEWKNGRRHGKGIYRYADGNVYDGEWKNSKYHGRGIYCYANGDVYEGDWQDGEKHGRGVYFYANGDVYEGDWKTSKPHGKGILRYANGDIYDGDWKNSKKHGKGIYRFSSGDVYKGEYQNSKLHGKGILRYAIGDVYEGEYKNSKKHGKGVYRYADGSVYDGEWQDGKYHGRGVYRSVTGSVRSGRWHDGKYHRSRSTRRRRALYIGYIMNRM